MLCLFSHDNLLVVPPSKYQKTPVACPFSTDSALLAILSLVRLVLKGVTVLRTCKQVESKQEVSSSLFLPTGPAD